MAQFTFCGLLLDVYMSWDICYNICLRRSKWFSFGSSLLLCFQSTCSMHPPWGLHAIVQPLKFPICVHRRSMKDDGERTYFCPPARRVSGLSCQGVCSILCLSPPCNLGLGEWHTVLRQKTGYFPPMPFQSHTQMNSSQQEVRGMDRKERALVGNGLGQHWVRPEEFDSLKTTLLNIRAWPFRKRKQHLTWLCSEQFLQFSLHSYKMLEDEQTCLFMLNCPVVEVHRLMDDRKQISSGGLLA